MNQITTSLLNAGIDIKVVAISTIKHPVVQNDEFEQHRNLTRFESFFIDTKLNASKIISSLFRRSCLQTDRFNSKEMTAKLGTLLQRETFDVVILESVFVGSYIETIRKYSRARILLRVHNVEFLIWERLSKQTQNLLKKATYRYLSNSLKRFELSLFTKIDGYMPITEVDHNFFKARFPNLSSKVIPFAINFSDYPYYERKIDEQNITFFHIGSMNWQPNIEGMNWFLDNVWERVIRKYPQLSLVLAGKGTKSLFEGKQLHNVRIFDFVESAQQFINEHDIMIVPLLSGSGMRIKIMEGLALGKPVITTTIGAEGIDVTDKEDIIIANTPEEMMQAIEYCAKNAQKIEEIGKNAKKLIQKKYTQEIISRNLISLLY